MQKKDHLNVFTCPILVIKFLLLALNFLIFVPKISPNFLSESAGQHVFANLKKKFTVGAKIIGSVGEPETQLFFFFFLALRARLQFMQDCLEDNKLHTTMI